MAWNFAASTLRPLATTVFKARAFSTVTGAGAVPESLWRLGKLNHVAIAVPNLQQSMALYRDVLGARVSEPQPQPEHGVYTVFVEMGPPKSAKIELVHPLGETSPITGFLAKNPVGGIHHICLETSNLKEAMKDMVSKKIRLLGKEPKIGAHGNPVIFLHPKDCGGVLVELEEVVDC